MQSLAVSIPLFLLAAAVIVVAGSRTSLVADRLADRTGWGEALFGGIFLAAVTSLPDFAATLTAVIDLRPTLAVSNIMGSMAVNLVFLVLADILYRRANLEHAAASTGNMIQATLMIALLAMPLLAMLMPAVSLMGIHPVSLLLFPAYAFGYHLVLRAHSHPMWKPTITSQTVTDTPDTRQRRGETLVGLWMRFAMLAFIVTVAGWALMKAAVVIETQTPLSESQVGTFFTALFTSLPELVITLTAIRQGALTLAVSNILGSNCFNVIVIAAADFAWRNGSLYHATDQAVTQWGMLTILMAAVLILGLLRRERFGIGRIGFESFLVLLLYIGALIFLFWPGEAVIS